MIGWELLKSYEGSFFSSLKTLLWYDFVTISAEVAEDIEMNKEKY